MSDDAKIGHGRFDPYRDAGVLPNRAGEAERKSLNAMVTQAQAISQKNAEIDSLRTRLQRAEELLRHIRGRYVLSSDDDEKLDELLGETDG